MNKEDRLKTLLVSMLKTVAEATIDMEADETDCGVLHYPVLKYTPTFEFDDNDIQLIKALEKDELEDFSTLTNS
ncbi:hypothetical protein [Bacteroides caccae]|uniref:hypothetical protein n=1 Tax=Bacteroides caccae TaxID=47678 RepID=UPI00356A826A